MITAEATVAIVPIQSNIYAVEAPCEPGVDVRALLVCGDRYSVLLDSLARPSDLDGVQEIVLSRETPLFVVNSHADWDHWWGNAAFADAPVIAHTRTVHRQRREGKRTLQQKQREDASFAEVVLRPATIGFEDRLEIDLGGLSLELSLLSGHTHDCIVAYIPERRLLFAGDTAEDPIPLVTEGPVRAWSEALNAWADRARTVVPAHGAVAGPELLRRNATYLENLIFDPARQVPELEGAGAFYRRAHRRNLRRAAAERGDA